MAPDHSRTLPTAERIMAHKGTKGRFPKVASQVLQVRAFAFPGSFCGITCFLDGIIGMVGFFSMTRIKKNVSCQHIVKIAPCVVVKIVLCVDAFVRYDPPMSIYIILKFRLIFEVFYVPFITATCRRRTGALNIRIVPKTFPVSLIEITTLFPMLQPLPLAFILYGWPCQSIHFRPIAINVTVTFCSCGLYTKKP